ncbi:TorF family putative porin [Alishewanella longhuensis]
MCLSHSLPAFADWQGNITASSDYLFNGVSQTLNRPALQGGLTYNFSNGVYVGGWTSNVDYDEGTKRELDGWWGGRAGIL